MIDVHDLILRVHALVSDALPGIRVLDGWNRVDGLQSPTVAIAHPPQLGNPAAEVDVAENEGGICAEQYDVTIYCSVASWNGDMEYKIKRAEVQGILTAIGSAIDADRDLGGVAFDTHMPNNMPLYQISDEKGTIVQADFVVVVRVYAS